MRAIEEEDISIKKDIIIEDIMMSRGLYYLVSNAKVGKSMLFLIEANPGPGLGVLLAFALFGKGQSKTTAPGAIIIHFLGGIHEIYFPYILMKPKMILAAIAGGMTGVATLNLTNAGLTAPASPGSIIAVLTMTAPGDHWKVILSVLLATLVAFLVGSVILKADKTAENDGEGFEEAYQYIVAEEGKHYADVDMNKDNLNDPKNNNRFAKYLSSKDLWTSALFGALGGAVAEFAFDNRSGEKQLDLEELFGNDEEENE